MIYKAHLLLHVLIDTDLEVCVSYGLQFVQPFKTISWISLFCRMSVALQTKIVHLPYYKTICASIKTINYFVFLNKK